MSNPVAGKTAAPLKLTLRIDQHGDYQVVGESQPGSHQVAASLRGNGNVQSLREGQDALIWNSFTAAALLQDAKAAPLS